MLRIASAFAGLVALAATPAFGQESPPADATQPAQAIAEPVAEPPEPAEAPQSVEQMRASFVQVAASVPWEQFRTARSARTQASAGLLEMVSAGGYRGIDISKREITTKEGKRPLQDSEMAVLDRYIVAAAEVQKLERQHMLSFVPEKERGDFDMVLTDAIKLGLDPRAGRKTDAGWMIKAPTPDQPVSGERAATTEEAAVLDRYESASTMVAAMMVRGMANVADVRVVDDGSLVGRTGIAKTGNTPFVSQAVVLNRAYEFTEPASIKWTWLDTQNNKPGDVLIPWKDRYCVRAVCYADDNADGKLDAGYGNDGVFNNVEVPIRVGRKLEPPKAPAGYREIAPPVSLNHEIGLTLANVRADKKSGTTTAQFIPMMRKHGQKSWTTVGQPIRIDMADGKGALEFMGGNIALSSSGGKEIAWTVVKPIPEQPFDPSLTTRTSYRTMMIPMFR